MRQFKALTTRRFGRALALAIGLAPILTMTAGHAQEKPAIPLSSPSPPEKRDAESIMFCTIMAS